MKWWPWSKPHPVPETRSTAQGYTASLTAALETGAGEGVADTAPLAVAALEACSGLYARCLAAAVVSGAPGVAHALTPHVLSLIARNLIRRGEDFHRIHVRRGQVALLPVGFAYATGNGADSLGWTYQTTEYGPTDSRHAWVPAASMVHCRYSVDSSRPWLGVPPWSWASETSRAVAALERFVTREARAAHGEYIGVPETPQISESDVDPDTGEPIGPLDKFRADLANARGRQVVAEHSAHQSVDVAAGATPKLEYLRFGMMRESVDVLRTATGQDVLAACGIPPSLFAPSSDGTAQRESYRRFLHSSLRPIARLIESELRLKLDSPGLELDLSELHAADVAGRARSFKAFTESGVHPEDAARETGVRLTRELRTDDTDPARA